MYGVWSQLRALLVQLVSVPPTERELRDNFPHLPTCRGDRYYDHPQLEDVGLHLFDVRFEWGSNLEPGVVTTYENFGGHWFSLTLPVERRYLKCRHCGYRAHYRVSNDTVFDQLAKEDSEAWMHIGQLW